MKCKELIAKVLVFGLCSANISVYSFANSIDMKEISNIETKEDLQKSAQRAVKLGNINSWLEGLANMPTKRDSFASAVVDGKIYCIGGMPNSKFESEKVEVYDPITDTWETKTSMPSARFGLTSAVVNGKIYCIGGLGTSGNLYTLEVYNPVSDTWESSIRSKCFFGI